MTFDQGWIIVTAMLVWLLLVGGAAVLGLIYIRVRQWLKG